MPEIPISIVVVDDEDFAEILAARFESMGHEVDIAKNGRDGLKKILERQPDIVFLDLQMPEMDGMEVLEELNRHGVSSTVVILTAYGTIPLAVEAMRKGAYDFLSKPLDKKEIERVLRHAFERHFLRTEKVSLVADISRQYGDIITQDAHFRSLIEQAQRAGHTDSTVLLLGESGTGKELFARHIHASSPRRERPFVAVNAAAIPETLFESELFGHERGAFTGAERQRKGRLEIAQGGTLFLDEIGNLSETAQAKLLRVLEEREFQRVGGEKTLRAEVRIIAATNRELKKTVDSGQFREDLYFRIKVVTFRLPPLRERPADIPLLADHFLRRLSQDTKRATLQLDDEAMGYLQAYSWPGNVRELRNVIEHLVVLAPDVSAGPELLPEEILSPAQPGEELAAGVESDPLAAGYQLALRRYQRWLIEEALKRCGGKHNRASELLRLNPKYLSRLKGQLGIQ